MTIQVLNSLWDKICNVFATKSELADIVENKQDRLTAGIGIRIEGNTIINQAIPTTDKEEIVQVAITFDSQESLPDGFDITEDLLITVFCNNELEPFGTYNLDGYGMCSFTIPYGYRYRIEFPTIQGYDPIPDEEHIATVIERSVEKKYITTSSEEDHSGQELVEIIVEQKNVGTQNGVSYTKLGGIELQIEINGESPIIYTTDNNGKTTLYIDYGLPYIITAPEREGYYFSGFDRTQTYTSNSTHRIIIFEYRTYSSGLTIMNSDGDEYTLKQWKDMVENNEVTNEEAKYIKVNSAVLAPENLFCLDIDMISNKTYPYSPNGYAWCNAGVKFSCVPGTKNADYNRFTGYEDSISILSEATSLSRSVPAIYYCLGLSRTIAQGTEREYQLQGFLGTVGQWAILWNNIAEFHDILKFVRSNPNLISSNYKWTCMQSDANNGAFAWSSTSVNLSNGKNGKQDVVPFFTIKETN